VQVKIIQFLKENNLLMTEMEEEEGEGDLEEDEMMMQPSEHEHEQEERNSEHEDKIEEMKNLEEMGRVKMVQGRETPCSEQNQTLKEINLFEERKQDESNMEELEMEKEGSETMHNDSSNMYIQEVNEDEDTVNKEDLHEENLDTLQDRSISEILEIKEDYLVCQRHGNHELLNLYDVDKKVLLCTNCVVEDRTSPFNEMRRVRLLKDSRKRVIDDFRERQNHLKDLEEGLNVREREVDLRKRELQRKKRSIEKDIQLQVEDMKKLVEETFKSEVKLAEEEEDADILREFNDHHQALANKKKLLGNVMESGDEVSEAEQFLRYLESNCYSYYGWEKTQRDIEGFLEDRGVKERIGEMVQTYLQKKQEQKAQVEINILDKIIEKLSKRRDMLTRSKVLEQKIDERLLF
jgi:hypothetical protein